ncbi:MAG: hypothetical protein LBU34_05065 [Planctomycetaceae bacterium]|jgi:hypothetical protein|nr:hypothetical protein [Planctomycetaceae bacterium]
MSTKGRQSFAEGFSPMIVSAIADQFLFLIWQSKGRQPFAEGLSPMVASASADLSSYALQGQ